MESLPKNIVEFEPNDPYKRQANGRFGKGNTCGRGNPYAKQVAVFRSTVVNALSESDLKEIVYALVEFAKKGDVAAAKLIFSYTLGTPPTNEEIEKMIKEEPTETAKAKFASMSTEELLAIVQSSLKQE